jgi:cell filamentation protein
MANYSLDPIGANCYPGTTVLINKFGITDETELRQAEIEITQEASARWEQTPSCKTFDFEHYKSIHTHLFQDLYDWAGQIRDVNISKKGTQFCPFDNIVSSAELTFARLNKLGYFVGLPRKKFITEFVDLYIATNYLHPFREGNGRTQRLFLAQFARNAGYKLNFADIDVDELMIATVYSSQGVLDGLLRIFEKEIKLIERQSEAEKAPLLERISKNQQKVEDYKMANQQNINIDKKPEIE